MWNEIKNCEDALNPIMNKWGGRDKDVTLFCVLVISLSYEWIEKTSDMTNDLSHFDEKRVVVQKRIMIYLSKYLSEKFELFPHALKKIDKLKEKEEWGKELDDLLCHRINGVISEKGHLLWVMKNDEVF